MLTHVMVTDKGKRVQVAFTNARSRSYNIKSHFTLIYKSYIGLIYARCCYLTGYTFVFKFSTKRKTVKI